MSTHTVTSIREGATVVSLTASFDREVAGA
jgi:hypothetical protein